MTNIKEADILKGQAIYTALSLKVYNFYVLDFSNKFFWRCPKQILLEQFNKYLSTKHLDIGVGTGYFLKSCRAGLIDISLMDINPDCLRAATSILATKNIKAKSYQRDIYKQQADLNKTFDSISMNYVLHCLPGKMADKAVCIKNASAMLKPGGVLFGSTIICDEKYNTKLSKFIIKLYNKKGIFTVQDDSLQKLKQALQASLTKVKVQVVGNIAIFSGQAPS